MKVRNMVLCALFVALLAVCGKISLMIGNFLIFTMQTFAVFLALGLLGGKRGTIAIFVYLLLGAVGLPVFAAPPGGLATLLGFTGGYLMGFLFSGLTYWAITAIWGNTNDTRLFAMLAGLLVCYACGCLWSFFGYLQAGAGVVALGTILSRDVLPYLLPDICKLLLAYYLTGRLRRFIL